MTSARDRHRDTSPASERARQAGLYLVATPIGNLGDISLRALDILKTVDAIACEDTRVTAKLLSAHGVRSSLIAYHDHNAARVRPALLARLAKGEAIALVSDAGTPLISDPGYKLVRAAREAGVPVTAAPGPSAVLAALSLSGLPSDRFFFGGFVPGKAGQRSAFYQELSAVPSTLVLFETPARLATSLDAATQQLGNRQAAVARELTKRFEEIRSGTLTELATHYREQGPPRGEVVLVIGPPEPDAAPADHDIDDRLRETLASQSLRDAVDAVTAETGLPRRTIYRRAIAVNKASS